MNVGDSWSNSAIWYRVSNLVVSAGEARYIRSRLSLTSARRTSACTDGNSQHKAMSNVNICFIFYSPFWLSGLWGG